MQQAQRKSVARRRRHARVRRHVRGTAERPRLVVFRSNAGIYAQLIDDREGHTLAAASTLESEVRSTASGADEQGGKSADARAVGARIAERAAAVGITKVVFDRGGNRYHGRVRALAEAAREGGLQF